MLIKKLVIIYVTLIILFSSVLTISVSSDGTSPGTWNKNWTYRQEIRLPILTTSESAKYQAIDMQLSFDHSCWAKNEEDHSVRVCCWAGDSWHELESQIYDLEFLDECHITKCGLVFLIPKLANGAERYFVFYDESETPSPNYMDHVNVTDEYFYFEPISGVSVEGDYYRVTQDDYIVYAVGQKGHMMNRKLSQVVIKEKDGTKEFDLINSDIVASFSFSYYKGADEENEISSDQKLISKKINVNGNLMVEFAIVSESSDSSLRTTNFYKYYYCPTKEKRMCIHVKHEVLEGGTVKGIENLDGRYGALVSYKSRSAKIGIMHFGEILPYLHIYGENNRIQEYHINTNPESKDREWVITYEDDCDLGENSWISYDNGQTGRAHAIIFSSNEGIVTEGIGERDGIQVSVAEKEYLDVVGAEIDYVAINFGRNSYEKGGEHDVDIPKDMVVEYNAEFFSSENDSYNAVIKEENIFKSLVKHRRNGDGAFEGDKNIHTLTVLSLFTGRISASPWLFNSTKGLLPIVMMELYKDGILVSSDFAYKPLIGAPRVKFPKLAAGDYVVKIYRILGKHVKNFIGIEEVKVEKDITINAYCTWEKEIYLSISDQNGKDISNAELVLFKNNTVVARNFSIKDEDIIFRVPFNLFNSYQLKAFYKDFIIYDEKLPMTKKEVDISLDIYDLVVDVKDKLGFSPGVNVRPFLTSSEMHIPSEIESKNLGSGKYMFEDIPAASYDLYVSYGSFSDIVKVDVPESGETVSVKFSAEYDLVTELFDSHGNPVLNGDQEIDIIRNGKKIYESISPGQLVSLPPGEYTVNVYSDSNLIGSKTISLTNDKKISVVTTLKSALPSLILGVVLVFILEIFVLLLFKKLSLNTFLKALAMAIILISLFQPWWIFNGISNNPVAEKNTEMFLIPQTMMETIGYNGEIKRDIATVPEMFTNFLGALVIVVCSGFALLGISFIPNIVLKRRFSKILIFSSALFFVLVSVAFTYGMSKISELSLGSIKGEGIIDVILPNGETVYMNSTWGMGLGFNLCMLASLIILTAGIIDYLRRKNVLKQFFIKK